MIKRERWRKANIPLGNIDVHWQRKWNLTLRGRKSSTHLALTSIQGTFFQRITNGLSKNTLSTVSRCFFGARVAADLPILDHKSLFWPLTFSPPAIYSNKRIRISSPTIQINEFWCRIESKFFGCLFLESISRELTWILVKIRNENTRASNQNVDVN